MSYVHKVHFAAVGIWFAFYIYGNTGDKAGITARNTAVDGIPEAMR